MITETELMWWCALHDKCKSLREIKSVCDLGVQELSYTDRNVFERTTRALADLCGEPDADLADCQSSADMWRRLKREIVSLDIVGREQSLFEFDLNRDEVPGSLKNHFDFVTNIGTTEHVFNQANCFKVVHDLCNVNGIMAHAVPSAGFESHGLFTYSLKLFQRLARDNEYECLDAWTSMDFHPDARAHKSDAAEFYGDRGGKFSNVRSAEWHPVFFYGLQFEDYRSTDACIYVILRKTRLAEFRIPMDLPDDYAGES